VEQVAREQDLGRLAGVVGAKAPVLQHWARVWLGELPADAPPPAVAEEGGGGQAAAPTVDEGWN
jgi:hypothetical protein